MDLAPSFLESGHVAHLRTIPARVEAQGMHGMTDIVNALVVAVLTGGHVLLEGNPGLGKTALVRALSGAMGLGKKAVGRIQFTPDLMPADITGTLMPAEDGSGRLVFAPGPVFCSLLLADEINRATAKTQSAMLEAMAEYQVTVLGCTHQLRHWKDDRRDAYRTPFMVMATQNPIDQDGTHALPEAQSDRFMFKINMAMPGADVIGKIIAKALTADALPSDVEQRTDDPVQVSEAVKRLHEISDAVLTVSVLPQVADHINNIVQASNLQFDQLRDISPPRVTRLRELVGPRVIYPLGPRAAMALARAATGWASVVLVAPDRAANETVAFTPQALAEMVVPVLRHRIRIAHDYNESATPQAEAAALDGFIRDLAAACAPDGPRVGNYPADFVAALERARARVKL
ncbi:MAG: AAA family ATPase, partial [Gemmobacter sp.]|nr:AAA family ATPase [Gemmobacter sp.]